MAKINEKINKSVHLGLSILDIAVRYGFLDDYVKPKYGIKAKL